MKFIPPVRTEIEAYAMEINCKIDAGRFVDFYEMRGWKLNTGLPMVSWKAAVRYWQRNSNGKPAPSSASLGALQVQLDKIQDEIRDIIRPGGAAYVIAPTGDKKVRYEQLVEQRHALKRRIEGYMT